MLRAILNFSEMTGCIFHSYTLHMCVPFSQSSTCNVFAKIPIEDRKRDYRYPYSIDKT